MIKAAKFHSCRKPAVVLAALLASACVSIPENSVSFVSSSAKRADVAILRGHNIKSVNNNAIDVDTGTIVVEPGSYKIHYGNKQYTYSLILNAKPGRTYLLTNELQTSGKGRYKFRDVTDDPEQHVAVIPVK